MSHSGSFVVPIDPKAASQVMYEQWRQFGEDSGLMALKQTELFVGQMDHLKIYEEHPNVNKSLSLSGKKHSGTDYRSL